MSTSTVVELEKCGTCANAPQEFFGNHECHYRNENGECDNYVSIAETLNTYNKLGKPVTKYQVRYFDKNGIGYHRDIVPMIWSLYEDKETAQHYVNNLNERGFKAHMIEVTVTT